MRKFPSLFVCVCLSMESVNAHYSNLHSERKILEGLRDLVTPGWQEQSAPFSRGFTAKQETPNPLTLTGLTVREHVKCRFSGSIYCGSERIPKKKNLLAGKCKAENTALSLQGTLGVR